MPNKSRAGFTLMEIMVALTVGGIALGSIYAIGSTSTRFFREQQRVSAAQTSLRGAMDLLKHDFERAGFMSTPNSLITGEACSAPAFAQNGWVGAINGYTQAVSPQPSKFDPDNLNSAAASFYTFDDVWLTGNFATSGEYPNIDVSADGFTVTIPMGWQSFQRDFTEWTGSLAATCNKTVFQATFAPGRMVRLHGMNGTFYYAHISTSDCTGDATASAVVTLVEPVPANCSMNSGWIAPVNTMYYHVVNSNDNEDDALKRLVVLKRTEVKPEDRATPLGVNGGNVAVDDRVLLDYVVRFSINFLGNFWDMPTNTWQLSRVPMSVAEFTANPEKVRGVIIDLAVRTSQPDSDFTIDVPTAVFKVIKKGQNGALAARVRRLRAEMLLPNLANRDL